jgi:hypothetical protein
MYGDTSVMYIRSFQKTLLMEHYDVGNWEFDLRKGTYNFTSLFLQGLSLVKEKGCKIT